MPYPKPDDAACLATSAVEPGRGADGVDRAVDAGTSTGTSTGAGTGSDTGTGMGMGTGTDTGPASGASTGTGAHAGAGSGAGAGAGTGADGAGPVAVVPRARPASAATGAPGVPRPVTGLAVVDAWSRLLAYLIVVTMVSFAIMMPIVGLVLALTGMLLLRIADLVASTAPHGLRRARRQVLRALAAALVSLPYAVAVGTAVAILLVSLAAVGATADPLAATAWGVGAGVYVLWAGPGVRAPRRQLTRLVTAIAPGHRSIGLAGAVLGVLAFLAILGAVALKPSFAPMYALQNTLQIALGHLQSAIEVKVGWGRM